MSTAMTPFCAGQKPDYLKWNQLFGVMSWLAADATAE
jgi:hypothetical protein